MDIQQILAELKDKSRIGSMPQFSPLKVQSFDRGVVVLPSYSS